MGPKRRTRASSRQVPYDMELPENWTQGRLRAELEKRGISVPSKTRKSRLISLVKESTSHVTTVRSPTEVTRQPSSADRVGRTLRHSSDMEDNQNGGDILPAIQQLTSSINSIQSNLAKLTADVQLLQQGAIGEQRIFNPPGPVPNSNLTVTDIPSEANFGTVLAALEQQTRDVIIPREAGTGSSSYVRTRYGYAAESLPFVETVSPQARKNIIEGKDVNLASLLIPYYTGPNICTDKADKPDQRLNKNLSICEFIQAFGIFTNIMCEAFANRRNELDLYERDIVDMATRYGGKAFYEYHKMFSLKAAAHLKHQNILVDWSVRNNTLFCNIFANMKPITCQACNSVSHPSRFCPLSAERGSVHNINHNRSKDTYGRNRQFFQGREICNNFNGDQGCQRFRCNNLHVCLSCKQYHSLKQCPASKN